MASKHKLETAYSAQPSIASINPSLPMVLDYLTQKILLDVRHLRIADQGCGKLRHLDILKHYFQRVLLIDTEVQLNKVQRIFGNSRTTIVDYVRSLKNNQITLMTDKEFDNSKLGLDIIFSICVFDVVLPDERRRIAAAAWENLKRGGLYILIVPRNDHSILRRCNEENRYYDGHLFERKSYATFYKNYRNAFGLQRMLSTTGFQVIADKSKYRQLCLICQKNI